MNRSFKVLFFLKRGKRCNEKALPIYIRVKVDSTVAEWSVRRQLEPGMKWNQKLGRVAGTKEDIRILNGYLDALQGNVFTIQKEYALRNESVTAQEVRAKILGKSEGKNHTLIEVFEYHNKQFKELVGLEFAHGTYKKFKTALTSLKKFIQWKYSKEDVYLTSVNHSFITDYEFYLKTVQKLQHNTAMGVIKKLKKIIRFCIANDWLDKDPFRSFKITTKETHRNFLLASELEILKAKQITVQRLDQVRDLFLFSCYTGLAYSDVVALTPKDLSIGIDGEKWIFINRRKTDTNSRVPLLAIPKLILEKYSDHPITTTAGTLLPKLSNQRLNSYLKEITDICGFKKELTFHCARHTFATTVTLTNGVPIETVGKMLGHKSLRTTQLYAKILDNKVSHDMNQLKQALSKKQGVNGQENSDHTTREAI